MRSVENVSKRFDWGIVALVVIMALLFWVRMSLSMSAPYLSYDSYLTVRSVEHIHDTGVPLRDDPLSITGKTRITNPPYDYLLALVTLASPLMYKAFPNLLLVLLLIPVYLITRRITRSSVMGIIAALLAGSGPVLFARYLNTPLSLPLALLLTVIILALLHDPEKYLFLLIFCSIALAFTHPLIFVLALAFLIMILLLRVEGYGVDERVNELFFFTILLAVWFYVLVYKKALFEFGITTVWQNLPHEYLTMAFGDLSLLAIMYGLGIVTFLFGTLGMYHALFENREKESYIIIAPIIAVALLLLVRLMPLSLGIVVLTPLLSILAAYGIGVTGDYLRRTKIPWTVYPLALLLVVFFVFSAVLPALANANRALQEVPSQNDVTMYKEVGVLLPRDAVLLTTIREAAAVQYFSRHTVVTDDDFLLVHNGDELVNDIDSVYTSRFAFSIISKAEKLRYTHVLFSSAAAVQYARDRLLIDDDDCVTATPISNGAWLYAISCKERVK